MGVKERRERERSEQRQRILNAALEIISRDGFTALSMRKLAERIEYSPASIYLYFENREQLAQELSEMGFRDLLAVLQAASATEDTAEAIHASGAAYVKFGVTNPAMYRLIFMGDSEFINAAFAKQDETSAGKQSYALLLALATRLQNAGVLQHLSVVEVVELIWSTLHGIVSLHISCTRMQLTPPQRLARLATESLTQGLNPSPRKPKSQKKRNS